MPAALFHSRGAIAETNTALRNSGLGEEELTDLSKKIFPPFFNYYRNDVCPALERKEYPVAAECLGVLIEDFWKKYNEIGDKKMVQAMKKIYRAFSELRGEVKVAAESGCREEDMPQLECIISRNFNSLKKDIEIWEEKLFYSPKTFESEFVNI